MAFVVFLNADDGAAAQALIGGRLVAEHFLRELEAIAADLERLAALAIHLDRARARIEHHGRRDVVALAFILQRVFEIFLGRLRPELNITFSAAIAVAAIVIHHARAHSRVGGVLVRRRQGRINPKAARIDVVLIALVT